MIKETIALDDRDHCQPCDGSNWVAAKGVPMTARAQQLRCRSGRNGGSDGEPVAQALGDGDHVRRDALVDVHEPAAAATHAGLYLIHPQQGGMLVADLPSLREIALRGHHYTVLSLDRLQHDCRHRLIDRGSQRCCVAVWYEDHLTGQRLERYAVLLVVSQRERAHGTSVKSTLG